MEVVFLEILREKQSHKLPEEESTQEQIPKCPVVVSSIRSIWGPTSSMTGRDISVKEITNQISALNHQVKSIFQGPLSM